MTHSESLAHADFFRHRFAFGAFVGAEMPAGPDVFYTVALEPVQRKLYCSCPFFPKPCMHAEALSLLFQKEGAAFFPETGEAPTWLDSLLSGKPAHSSHTPDDPEKRAARQEKTRFERLERARGGFDDLEAWLSDTVRRGLATVVSEEPGAFDQLATRAADASMTGLSRAIRLLAHIPASSPDWSLLVTDVLAQIYLAVRAFRNRETLPDALLHDLQNFIGINLKKEEVLASGERRTDTWAVMGIVTEPLEDRLLVRRTWLLGAESGRMALLLDFSFGGSDFQPGFDPGTMQHGTLVFYPSAFPQRALVQEDFHRLPQPMDAMPGVVDIAAFLEKYAAALAAQPWLPYFAEALSGVTVHMGAPNQFFFTDVSGKMLPMHTSERTGWSLIALGGGHPLDLFGEWNGRFFRPLSAVAEGRLVSLG